MNNQTKLQQVVYELVCQNFREMSRGWFRGWIITPSPFGPWGKNIKLVNGGRMPDRVSAYPKLTKCTDCHGTGRHFVDEGWPDAACESCYGRGYVRGNLS